LNSYDLFISHSWGSASYDGLVDLLRNRGYFNFRNYSVPANDPLDAKTTQELYNKIEEQVRQASCVLVLGSMHYHSSKWIDKEMEMARRYRKDIILVKPRGQERVPVELQNVATKIVAWNADSIVTAIRGY
jgi:hypothetical protein